MFTVNNEVVNLVKALFEEYNGRTLDAVPAFGLYLELVYTPENLKQFLNLVYKELSVLNGFEYSDLQTVEQVKNFASSKGLLDPVPGNDETFLEHSLLELCSTRTRMKKRLFKDLNVSFQSETPFDDYVVARLNDLKLGDLDAVKEEDTKKKRQLNTTQFDESQLEELRVVSDELAKDYFTRWNAYLYRFYNLLHVFFKVKKYKDSKDLEVLMETLKAWRKNTHFRQLNLYDVYTYKPDASKVTKISSETGKANRVSDLHAKVKLSVK